MVVLNYSTQSITRSTLTSPDLGLRCSGESLKGASVSFNLPSNDINYLSSCSSHLQDLKEITHDFLYENYRTEKLSRTVSGGEAE